MAFSGLDPFKLTGIERTKNELGTGSYASVYELNYLGLKCAGKKLHESLLKQGGGTTYALRRFEEECHLLSQMRHPNIVQFLGVYFEQGMQVPILVMEFLPSTLTHCIKKNGILRSELSYSILHDVALGLNYFHSHAPPIIHRDLSSNNVLLTPDMKAKVSDLGVAKIVNLTPLQVSRMVHNTQAPGTPAYMPPEALVATPKYDKSIDVFSFGIMMIHVFSGKWPEPQEAQIRIEHDSDRMIPLSEAERREVFLKVIGNKHSMMNLIRQCISNNPKKRPNTNEIVLQLKNMMVKNPPSFSNRLEMLQQMDTERKSSEEKFHTQTEKLQLQIERLQLELKAITKKQENITQPTFDRSIEVAGATESTQKQYEDDCYRHGQAPQDAQQDHDYVNLYIDHKFQQYNQPNADAQTLHQECPSDSPEITGATALVQKKVAQLQDHHYVNIYDPELNADAQLPHQECLLNQSGTSHHNFAAITRSNTFQYVDQPHDVPTQQNIIAAATVPSERLSPERVYPNLTVGSRIQLPTHSPTEPFKYGIICWIGEVPPILGLVAGIEMDECIEGCTDGTLTSTGQKFFECMPGRGIYYPLVNLQADVRFMDPENLENNPKVEQLNADAQPPHRQWPSDQSGHNFAAATRSGASQYRYVDHHLPVQQNNMAAVVMPPRSAVHVHPNLTVGSRIQLPTPSPIEPFKYGVIRWIGKLSTIQGLVAGVEMDKDMEGCTDGTCFLTGQRFFECKPGRGVYFPLVNLQSDLRSMDPVSAVGADDLENRKSAFDNDSLMMAETNRHTEQNKRYSDRKRTRDPVCVVN